MYKSFVLKIKPIENFRRQNLNNLFYKILFDNLTSIYDDIKKELPFTLFIQCTMAVDTENNILIKIAYTSKRDDPDPLGTNYLVPQNIVASALLLKIYEHLKIEEKALSTPACKSVGIIAKWFKQGMNILYGKDVSNNNGPISIKTTRVFSNSYENASGYEMTLVVKNDDEKIVNNHIVDFRSTDVELPLSVPAYIKMSIIELGYELPTLFSTWVIERLDPAKLVETIETNPFGKKIKFPTLLLHRHGSMDITLQQIEL